MGGNSKIEWTDASWTPVRARNLETGKVGWHCEHATPGCGTPTEGGCYAESMNKRLGTGLPFKPGHRKDIELFLDEAMLLAPLRWKKPRMIFVCSMTDAFADFVKDEWLDRMFAVMALCPQHTFQVLTKRADRMRDYMQRPDRKRTIAEHCMPISCALARDGGHAARIKLDHFSACFAGSGPFKNIWLGVSAERQAEADERIPLLMQTPAAVRFISAEPLLGPISLRWANWDNWKDADGERRRIVNHLDGARMLDWVIAGGESGRSARPMHPDWPRALRDQCAEAGVPFFFKQWGEWAGVHDVGVSAALAEFNAGRGVFGEWHGNGGFVPQCVCGSGHGTMIRVGKKSAGRLLDGAEHNGFPQAKEVAFA